MAQTEQNWFVEGGEVKLDIKNVRVSDVSFFKVSVLRLCYRFVLLHYAKLNFPDLCVEKN